jgi:transcriptional regulator with XRE-family HTH domain
VNPDAAGLSVVDRARRKPGLRREEGATLAGVSAEYYARLESGRASGASPQVLDAISQALSLNDAERKHLYHLFGSTPRAGSGGTGPAPQGKPPRVRAGLQSMLDSFHGPAVLNNYRLDLVAANSLGQALYEHAAPADGSSFNFARYVFLDPLAQTFYVDWKRATRNSVALLRAAAGRFPRDTELHRLITDLSGSERFQALWESHDVIQHEPGMKHYQHPLVGELVFGYEAFQPVTDPDLSVLIYLVEPGSATERALGRLATSTGSGTFPIP